MIKNVKFGFIKTKQHINKIGSIAFIRKSERYLYGHFLLKTENGFMDSWINHPKINPAKADFRKKLPGIPQWVIYEINPLWGGGGWGLLNVSQKNHLSFTKQTSITEINPKTARYPNIKSCPAFHNAPAIIPPSIAEIPIAV